MLRILYTLLLPLLLISCKKDFLEIVPKGSLIATTVADYELMMNSARFYDYDNGLPTLVLGDEVAAEESYFQNAPIRAQNAFKWEADLYEEKEVAWETDKYLTNLYPCNKIINEVMTATDGTDAAKRLLRAEALATRAWVDFQLVSFYAKPYQATTAATDPGFPRILQSDVSQKTFERGTVQQSYDFIIDDLASAIKDLPVKPLVRTRMSKPAARAILGKVLLFMGRNSEALKQFDSTFNDLAGTANPPALYNYNETFAPGGSFLPIGFFGPNYPGNNPDDFRESLVAKTNNGGSYNGNGFGNDGLVLSPQAVALYSSTDFRRQFYSDTYEDGTPIPGGRVRKYALQYVKTGMQLADLYLLRAEARARTNDLPDAKADLEFLRSNRMPPADAVVPPAIAGNQQALLAFIMEERTREFAMEGYRWFDMRRLSVDPQFSGSIYTHTIYQVSGIPVNYNLPSGRLVLKIPPYIMAANPQMINNP